MKETLRRYFLSLGGRISMKAVSLVLASLLVCAVAMPGMAADSRIASAGMAAPSQTLVDLDLSSTDSTLNAAHVVKTRPVTICVGGKPLLVTSRTRVTAAEMAAVYQVIDSGRQAIQIGVHGNAAGGASIAACLGMTILYHDPLPEQI